MGWGRLSSGNQKFMMEGVWLFILAVNFWNIFGAGVLGSLINLPIINYFEHATYITGNHAHAAMFGVKGNIALAGVLFCCQHLFTSESWNPRLVKISFWSLNIGLALMMFLALFPAGMYQLGLVLEHGYWAARTQEVLTGETFKMFVNLRGIGISVFSVGMLMMVWFILSRGSKLKKETQPDGDNWVNHDNDWHENQQTKEKSPINS
jgi:nitric oxide reductase subunit B